MKALFVVFLLIVPHLAFSAPWKDKADDIIKKQIKSSGISTQNFSIWVRNGDQVAELNSGQLFVPASLSKIPTALAFLSKTSMDNYFHTWVYKRGEVKDGVLKGDLYLKGGGDPSFVNESMWMLINKLKRTDIKKIDGNLYVDETYFDDDYYSDGRQQKRVDRAYDAPVSALSFNWNAVSIYIRPGDKAGQPARVYVDPPVPFIKVTNKAKTSSSKNTLKVERELKGDNIEITVEGEIASSVEEKAFFKSVGDAALWTGLNFKYFLNQFGIEYTGTVSKKKVPVDSDMIVEADSWSMAQVVAAMSKFSNNFVAEMLTKHLGREENSPGNIKDGVREISSYLSNKGWKSSEYEFINPSGFTRNNKLRSDKLGELLHMSLNNFKLAPEFLSSLPISGTDGTLKKRMRQVMREKVRAKTGYLSGVVSLAGYLDTQGKGEPITFVFIYNGPYKHDWDVRDVFDKILWRLYQET